MVDPGDAVVGWLRVVEAGAERRGGLLLASVDGEMLGFAIARMAAPGGAADNAAMLAERLVAPLSPGLLFARADELPPQSLAGAGGRPALCRVEPMAAGDAALDWSAGSPPSGTAGAAALAELMRQPDPFSPLARVGAALAAGAAIPAIEAAIGLNAPLTQFILTPPPNPVTEGEALAPLWAALMPPAPALPVLADPPAPPPEPLDPALDWPGALLPFQREGVEALLSMDRLLLSDDMGLGKTVQAIAALRILRARGEVASGLVVAPAGLLDQWRRELHKWAPELSAIIVQGSAVDRNWQWAASKAVFLVSYDTLRSDAGLLPRLRDGAWDVVVLDEAQRIKNPNPTSEAAKSLPRARSWALTGTPIENSEAELASIMEFVDHDPGGPRRHYQPGAALRHRHRELQLRRRKGDVLHDLPPKRESVLTVELHPDQRRSYDRAEREGVIWLRSLGADVTIAHILELILRLKQICNADPRRRSSSKLDDIRDRLDELTAQGHRALVFSQFTSESAGVAAAARHLRGFNPLTLTGETPPPERPALIQRFRTDPAHKVLILSLRAGGLGLNLQEASYVFHLDRWWNPAVENQADDRVHRLGQKEKVNVIKYVCRNTIEERIERILTDKRALFDELVDPVSLDLSTRLTRIDLLGLFGLR